MVVDTRAHGDVEALALERQHQGIDHVAGRGAAAADHGQGRITAHDLAEVWPHLAHEVARAAADVEHPEITVWRRGEDLAQQGAHDVDLDLGEELGTRSQE